MGTLIIIGIVVILLIVLTCVVIAKYNTIKKYKDKLAKYEQMMAQVT